MTVDDIIPHGDVTGTFIRSATGVAVFEELGKRYFVEFKSAKTPEEANAAWAKARALDDLQIALQAVADAGTLEKTRLAKEAAMQARAKRP